MISNPLKAGILGKAQLSRNRSYKSITGETSLYKGSIGVRQKECYV